MKSLVVYSSRTGNTRKVAGAIFDILPEPREIFPVETAPAAGGYDFIAVGFWVDKGRPDELAANYIQTIQGATVGLFGTLGASPDSEHARSCLKTAMDMLGGNKIAGTFLCQGRIDPIVIEEMKQTAPAVHPMTPERIARIQAAESHPDEADLKNAQAAFSAMVLNLRKESGECVK